MPVWHKVYTAACFATIGFCIFYVACDFGDWPRLTYFQLERSWQWTTGLLLPLPSNYVGTVLWGIGGAMLSGGVAYGACLLWRRSLSPRVLRLFGAWAFTAFLGAGMYYTWNLWPF